ncbi:MAG TPA: M28 family peptidase, partial [Candidatus Thermoplasmatota archaeon]|nr:M28 family peptidase [Candidatus Thermoplasmatota archaeon]
CTTPAPPAPTTANNTTGGNGDGNGTATAWLAFDENRAWDWVLRQVQYENGTYRYRIPGTPENTAVANELAAGLRAVGWTAHLQHFSDTYRCRDTPLHNVVATLPGRTNETIILGAHYDSRPLADQDPDPAKRGQPVVGANDGGSGVAVLLEMARVMAVKENRFTYTIVLFDGEDGGHAGAPDAGAACSPWIVGSEYYAQNMTAEEVARTRVMILLDMVGDKNLTLRREQYSAIGIHRPFQDLLYATAGELGHAQVFSNESGGAITDDHRPFQKRRIPAVDLVHQDGTGTSVFPDSWHTTLDTPEHMSRESLKLVAEVVLATLEKLERGR